MGNTLSAVTVVLDKERHLRMTLGGMKKFSEVTGKNLLKDTVNPDNADELIVFIWSCLIWEDRQLTVEDVGYMLDFNRLEELSLAMQAAWKLAKPEGQGSPNA